MKKSIFWIVTGIALVFYLTLLGNSFVQTFYFTCFFIPIAIGTSYFLNEVLVPQYYITKRLFYFSLYTVYLFIISLFFQNLVIIFSLYIFESFQKQGYNNLTINVINLNVLIYMIVLLNGFFHLLSLANKKNIIIQKLEERVGESDDKTIQVRYKRKNYPIKEKDIVYIESLSDYLKIVTQNQEVTTKMTMKNIEEELSKDFIRIHRSFIVGLRHISSFNKEYLSLGDVQLPISRTYKKKTIELLEK